jgi:4-alpha-glucanotransferase
LKQAVSQASHPKPDAAANAPTDAKYVAGYARLWERRRVGALLHPTSLPGSDDCGVLGADARRCIDLLVAAGFTVWQTLPLGPVDNSLSPYQLKSVHAGNPRLIDRQAVPRWTEVRTDFKAFWRSERHWLLPYALFVACRRANGNQPWWHWPPALRDREPAAVSAALATHPEMIRETVIDQYLFDRQWQALKRYANSRGLLILGDLPFYVDQDSVEVWWHRTLFQIDQEGQPTVVAGVPPDYFSADGQLWGNPIYAWDRMAADGFRWWVERVAHQMRRFDALRLDHFRAFESHWEIPAAATSARSGCWKPTPGVALLETLQRELGELPFLAEDLGLITPPVHELRQQFDLPGMLVLQFAFDGSADNPYLPANHATHAAVYTGTHDNDTTVGWYSALDDSARAAIAQALGNQTTPMPDALIEAALASPAQLAVLPMQDLLGLDSRSRMNVPGTPAGNWTWRFKWEDVPPDFATRFRELAGRYRRLVA